MTTRGIIPARLRSGAGLTLAVFVAAALPMGGAFEGASAQPGAAAPGGGGTAVSQPVVVINDSTPLRPEDAEVYYPAALAKAGTVLRADMIKGDWVRVNYPPGSRAILPASDGALDGSVVRLTRPSRLIAAHAGMASLEGYMPLLAGELPPGTALKYIEGGKLSDKSVFVVAIPAEARAWVPRNLLRQATPEEAAKLETPPAPPASPTPGAATAPAVTPPVPTPASPSSTPAAPAGTNPAAGPAAPVATAPATGPGAAPAGASPASPAAPGPSPALPGEPAAAGPSDTTPTAPPVPPPPPAKPAELVRAEALIEVFDRLRAQPAGENETEYNAALGEIRTFVATLSDTPRNRAIRRGLESRAAALELLADNARFRREQRERLSDLDRQRGAAGRQLAELDAQRVYAFIGRLVPSTVYDGQRLPLMYRVQSPEPGSFRTLGYLLPNQLELGGKLGTVVGIQGESRFDDALRAVIITPTRVDVVSLSPLPGQSSPSPSPAPTPAAPAAPAAPGAAPAEPEKP